jgi:hypothetical protein
MSVTNRVSAQNLKITPFDRLSLQVVIGFVLLLFFLKSVRANDEPPFAIVVAQASSITSVKNLRALASSAKPLLCGTATEAMRAGCDEVEKQLGLGTVTSIPYGNLGSYTGFGAVISDITNRQIDLIVLPIHLAPAIAKQHGLRVLAVTRRVTTGELAGLPAIAD